MHFWNTFQCFLMGFVDFFFILDKTDHSTWSMCGCLMSISRWGVVIGQIQKSVGKEGAGHISQLFSIFPFKKSTNSIICIQTNCSIVHSFYYYRNVWGKNLYVLCFPWEKLIQDGNSSQNLNLLMIHFIFSIINPCSLNFNYRNHPASLSVK